MHRSSRDFSILQQDSFKEKLFYWAQQYSTIAWLDSNSCPHLYPSFDAVLAIGASTVLKTGTEQAFHRLKTYRATTNDWLFGYFSYDLKNDLEALVSENPDATGFPDMYFFQPEKLIVIKGNTATFSYLPVVHKAMEDDYNNITNCRLKTKQDHHQLTIEARLTKNEYLERVQSVLEHIKQGNVYEANFCQEFYADEATIDPYTTYTGLNAISRAPFSAFLRLDDHYLLSASPERYLKKEGTKLIAQPIKGTAQRSPDPEKDKRFKNALKNCPKERAENIMIVDLLRNDLSKMAQKGSVSVEELCKVYTFKQLHQMISTITCTTHEDIDPVDIVKATFPMGSMTGAPKIAAMKIIEQLELSRRGLYSGAVGYFTPEGDLDLNVVIRSILYNAAKKYVSFSVGSAITAKSDPEAEYRECLAKAAAMQEVLGLSGGKI